MAIQWQFLWWKLSPSFLLRLSEQLLGSLFYWFVVNSALLFVVEDSVVSFLVLSFINFTSIYEMSSVYYDFYAIFVALLPEDRTESVLSVDCCSCYLNNDRRRAKIVLMHLKRWKLQVVPQTMKFQSLKAVELWVINFCLRRPEVLHVQIFLMLR